jgi:hypothetical protein
MLCFGDINRGFAQEPATSANAQQVALCCCNMFAALLFLLQVQAQQPVAGL